MTHISHVLMQMCAGNVLHYKYPYSISLVAALLGPPYLSFIYGAMEGSKQVIIVICIFVHDDICDYKILQVPWVNLLFHPFQTINKFR